VPIPSEDVPALVAWAKVNKPDLTVIGPEVPLCLGITDALNAEGFRVFGPCKAGARMEGSKLFSKDVMTAAGVPTARSLAFTKADEAIAALDQFDLPVVIKADGLAAVMATGRSDYPNQINNVLAFPGIFRGALDAHATDITEGMKLAAAIAIAESVTDAQLKPEFVVPSVFDRTIVERVAPAVAAAAVADGVIRKR
jgi:hypothetical protein